MKPTEKMLAEVRGTLDEFEQAIRDDEARKAADRVEALPYRDHGRTVNRNHAIMAARRGLPR